MPSLVSSADMRKVLLVALGLAGLLSLILGLAYKKRRPETKLAVATVEKDVRDHLAIGASRIDVETYLESRGIHHSYVEQSPIAQNRHTETALIRGTSQTWLIRGDIQILFKFDDEGRLTRYSVKEIFTGP